MVEIIAGAFIGAALATVAIGVPLFVVAHRWLDSLDRIINCVEKRDAQRGETDRRREATDREIVRSLQVIAENQRVLAAEMELTRQATRSLVSDTEKLRQRIERWEAQQRGNRVSELEQRRYRTAEEDAAIGGGE